MIDTAHVLQIAQEWYGLQDPEITVLPGEIDLNFKIRQADGQSFVLKISHPNTEPELLDFQNELLQHLAAQSLPLLLPNVLPDRSGAYLSSYTDSEGQTRQVRLLSWVDGRVWAKVNPPDEEVLESLGEAVGMLDSALANFQHPAAHRELKWDAAKMPWIEAHLTLFEGERLELLQYFLALFQKQVAPQLSSLRHSIIYNDANDYNILLNDSLEAPRVISLIDYGDALHTCTICDLAIAIAYGVMGKPDPLAAAATMVRGYHRQYALQEAEAAVLLPLVAARLCISVTVSALNRQAYPQNTYLQISDQAAWALLEKLRQIPPALAHYTFRNACGWEPCPQKLIYEKWIATHQPTSRVADVAADVRGGWLDFSVGSLDLGHNHNFEDTDRFERHVEQMLEAQNIVVGAGGYNEVRPFYTTDSYTTQSNNGPKWRTVHLGLDLWAPAEVAILAPLDGVVYSACDNAGERDYGPTLILEHRPSPDLTFYTLYGHLSRASIAHWKKGMHITQGQVIAAIGPRPENGNWPPHLHMQVMLDLLGNEGDFPGVAYPDQRKIWTSICPDPAPLAGWGSSPTLPDEHLPQRRREQLGSNLSLSYRKPLHIVRAHRQYLYDHEARRYLDMVNNVPHLGHQHEQVVRAGQRQMAVLNTNTRYLHRNIVELAEALLATLPPELNVCYFVNSGSEANELALRMARVATQRKNTLVIEGGYHGNTAACIEVSSYKFDGPGGEGTAPFIHKLPLPDSYRLDHENIVNQALAASKAAPPLAAFIHESILSCGGQLVPPHAYFSKIYEVVRNAGGLCIADEVQTGLGRVGEQFWAFQLHDIVPDIVTIGKPLGNGHPIGAVVVRRGIAETFANGMEYFNTFGGNPVSCAIAKEVLQIVHDEQLQNHAKTIGDYLLAQFRNLRKKYPLIGDVRGAGLFLGLELVEDPITRKAAPSKASYLVNRMRACGILMSTDGPQNNVIKIKPPMCITQKNADFLVEQLVLILQEFDCWNPKLDKQ